MLLEWCELDPVDTWEMGRNEVVQKIQGNRNVFIDYPELAFKLFDKEVPSDMTTPSGEAKNSASTTPDNPGTTPEDPGTTPEDPGTTPEDPGTTPEDPGTTPENPGTEPENPDTPPSVDENCNHKYDNSCDDECNLCGTVDTSRGHTYSATCDADCDVCGEIRSVGRHLYSGACDTTCNRCGAEREANHLYSGWHVVEEATETDPGLEKSTCIYCGAEGEREIPKLGSSGENEPTTPETPNQNGGNENNTADAPSSFLEVLIRFFEELFAAITEFFESLGKTTEEPTA